jgi:ATP-binding cassette, subfamily B, bacterial
VSRVGDTPNAAAAAHLGVRCQGNRLAASVRCALNLSWSASRWIMVALALLTVAGGLLAPAAAWAQRQVIDGLVSRLAVGIDGLLGWAAFLAVCGAMSAVLPYASAYLSNQLRRVLGLRAQDRLFRAVNAFPGLRRFESSQFMDKLQIAQGTSQTGLVTVVNGVFAASQSAVAAVGLLGALWLVSPVLCGLVLAASGTAVWAQLALSKRGAQLQWRLSPASRRQMFYSQLQTDVYAAKELRLFGLTSFLRERMLTEIRGINRQQRLLDRRTLVTQGWLALVGSAVTAAGLVWTVRQAWQGHLPVGDVSLFVLAAVGVQASLSGVVTATASSYQALLMLGHYLDVLMAGPDLPIAASPRDVPPLRHGIAIRDVWFRYADDQPWILRGVTLFIPRGASVALIGLNGAGKTTLVKLLCRLYDPDRGSICWDGVDVRDVSPEQLRNRMGAVFQDYMSYAMTAAENIGLGDLGRLDDQDAIRLAAKQACVDDLVADLPSGYQTMLSRIYVEPGDEAAAGVMLSGGQWQRIALARGLMRADRDLLILDEPNSGLDADAEYEIHQRLGQIRTGRTSLLISQRLAAVRTADIICVLSAGRVAEQGTHAELMTAGGEYYRLFTLQASGYAGASCASPAIQSGDPDLAAQVAQ